MEIIKIDEVDDEEQLFYENLLKNISKEDMEIDENYITLEEIYTND